MLCEISKNKAVLFFISENKTKTITQKYWKTHAKSVEGSVVHLCFVSRIWRLNKRRTRNERLLTCFYHIGGDFNPFLTNVPLM